MVLNLKMLIRCANSLCMSELMFRDKKFRVN